VNASALGPRVIHITNGIPELAAPVSQEEVMPMELWIALIALATALVALPTALVDLASDLVKLICVLYKDLSETRDGGSGQKKSR